MKERNNNLPPFGKNIQRLRKQKQLSLEILAERSTVSKAMLSQIEKGKVNPTIGLLWKIAGGLHVQLRDLLSAQPDKHLFQSLNFDNTPLLKSDDGTCTIQILSPPKLIEAMELYILHFEPGGALESGGHSPHTEEIVTALSGKIEVQAGDATAILNPYDSQHYSADVIHSIRNQSKTRPAKAYLAVKYQ